MVMGPSSSKFNCFQHDSANSGEKAAPGSTEALTQSGNSVQNQNPEDNSGVPKSPALVKNSEDQKQEETARDPPEPQSGRKSEEKPQQAAEENPAQNQQLQNDSKLKSSSAFVVTNEAEAELKIPAKDPPKSLSSRKSEEKIQKLVKNLPKANSKIHHERLSKKEADYDYIHWQGFDDSRAQTRESCYICHLDLAASALYSEGYKDGFSNILPEVAVLPCGHVFHAKCLEFHTPEELSRDPPCTICKT